LFSYTQADKYQKLVQKYGVQTVPFEAVWRQRDKKASIVFTDNAEMLTIDLCERMRHCNTKLCVLQNPMQQNLSDKRATLINKPFYSLNFCQILNGESNLIEKEEDVLCFMAPEAKLLIVDDHEMNLKVAKGLLEPLHVQIDTAVNGKEAVDKVAAAHSGEYAVVLMDIQMPIMDGYEATKTIRDLDNRILANIPIVAMTANAFGEERQKAFACGMNGYVTKPIEIDVLFETLKQIIE